MEERKLEPVEERLRDLGVNIYDIRNEDAYLRASDLLNRTENRLSNVTVQLEEAKEIIFRMKGVIDADKDLIKALNGENVDTDIRVKMINQLAHLVHEDAMRHGLYHSYDKFETGAELRKSLAARIGLECSEAHNSADDMRHYQEELADIILMTLSAAEHLDIDIGRAVELKRLYNTSRPYNHGKDDGSL